MKAAKKRQTRSLAALFVSLLPLAALVPVFLNAVLPDGVRIAWAVCNSVLVPAGLLLSVLCVKDKERRSAASILSTAISAALALLMLGIVAFALASGLLR